jgi:hypothetical protein
VKNLAKIILWRFLQLYIEKAALHLPVPISGRNFNLNYLRFSGCTMILIFLYDKTSELFVLHAWKLSFLQILSFETISLILQAEK